MITEEEVNRLLHIENPQEFLVELRMHILGSEETPDTRLLTRAVQVLRDGRRGAEAATQKGKKKKDTALGDLSTLPISIPDLLDLKV